MPIPHLKHSKSWRDANKSYSLRKQRQRAEKSAANKEGGAQKKKRIPRGVGGIIKMLLPYAFLAGAAGVLVVLLMFVWYSRDLPRPDKIIDRSVAQSTKIYDRTGEHLLFEAFGNERRTIIPLEDIPEYITWGTVLVEDKNFYTHSGFDLKGIIRAVIKNFLAGRRAEGGSTLTQQLVKNAILTTEKAYSRKIKEIVLSYQIENKFSKDQILQLYFNEIPYGSNAYGIESAAQFYFNTSAKELTIAQGSLLAALPQAPSYFSPYGSHVAELLWRKNYIIGLLESNGKITPEEAHAAREEEIEFAERKNLLQSPHFVIMVREQLAEKYGEREVEQGGLRVTTTLDWDLQQKAEAAVMQYAETNAENFDATNEALVALDPKNGQILAMVGSRDYFDDENGGNFNVATQGKRQPGSSFKPFVYAAAFEKGYTDNTTIWDVVTEFGEKADGEQYAPRNYDLKEHGPVSIREALAGSMNIPAVKMLYLVGSKEVIKNAQDFGYTTFTAPDRYGLSLVLGGAEVTLLEHTRAYATLANEGVYQETSSILEVLDKNGKKLDEYKEKDGKRVMDAKIVQTLTDILSDNEARAPYFGSQNYLTLGARPVAGKTGTTNDYRDAWMIGYTPSLAVGVWVGNNDFSAMKRGAGGSKVAAPIWNAFMKSALEDTEVEQFEKPEIEYPDKPILRGDLQDGTPVKIDRASGKLATERTPESFIEEKVFRVGHNILYYVDPEDPAGPQPAEDERDPFYSKWEEAVQRWVSENEWESEEGAPPTEEDDVHVFDNIPSIAILAPSDRETITTETIIFRADAQARRGISRVEFFVDGNLITQSRTSPYTGRYIPDLTVANGFHTMQTIAYDDVDNSASAEITFNLFLEKTNFSVNWNSPKPKTVIQKNGFPVTVSLSVESGTPIERIELFAEKNGDENHYELIKSIENPGRSVSTSWESAPKSSGDYEIYALFWDNNNVPHRISGVTVSVAVDEPKEE